MEEQKKVLINMEPALPDDENHDTMFTLKVDENSDALKGFVSRQRVPSILCVIIIVLLLLNTGFNCFTYFMVPQQAGLVAVIDAPMSPSEIPGWDDSAIAPPEDDTVQRLNEKLEQGKMCINMASHVYFENAYASGKVNIYNDEANNYPQFVTIVLDSNNQTVYQTGLIDVGKCIMYAPLDIVLEKGDHNCTAIFTQVDPTTNKVCGQAAAKIKITISN